MKRLFFLAAGMFAMGCEDYLFAGLLPGISSSLRTSVVAVAQGCSLFGLAFILSAPLCAILLSKRSVRDVLITALVLFLAGDATTLRATGLTVYLASRFVAGLGGGLFLPVAVAAATQLVKSEFRGRVLSLMWGFHVAGAVVGVPLGLRLADRFGWRNTVVLILILAAFALVGVVMSRQALRVEAPPPSLGGQIRLLANPRVLAVIGVTLLTAAAGLGLYAYITQILAGVANSPDVAFSLWSVGGLIGTMGVGYVVDRTGQPQTIMVVILAVLLLTISAIPALRGVPVFGFLPFLVWGAMGWATVTPQQCSLMKLEPDHEAILVALNSSAVSLGGVVGTILIGFALAGGLGAGKLPYVATLFLVCALVCQMLLARTKSRELGDAGTT
jgi:predicted MFS family arabinose efflux permease